MLKNELNLFVGKECRRDGELLHVGNYFRSRHSVRGAVKVTERVPLNIVERDFLFYL